MSSSGDVAATQAHEHPAPSSVNTWLTSAVRFLHIVQKTIIRQLLTQEVTRCLCIFGHRGAVHKLYYCCCCCCFDGFLTCVSHTAYVIDIGWTSLVRLSVCLSVTRLCYIETAQPIVKLSLLRWLTGSVGLAYRRCEV